MSAFHLYLLGVASTLSLIASVVFLKAWRNSADRLFLGFSVAFALLAINWGGVALSDPQDEARHWAYVFRLVAFLVIVAAIADKNWARRS